MREDIQRNYSVDEHDDVHWSYQYSLYDDDGQVIISHDDEVALVALTGVDIWTYDAEDDTALRQALDASVPLQRLKAHPVPPPVWDTYAALTPEEYATAVASARTRFEEMSPLEQAEIQDHLLGTPADFMVYNEYFSASSAINDAALAAWVASYTSPSYQPSSSEPMSSRPSAGPSL